VYNTTFRSQKKGAAALKRTEGPGEQLEKAQWSQHDGAMEFGMYGNGQPQGPGWSLVAGRGISTATMAVAVIAAIAAAIAIAAMADGGSSLASGRAQQSSCATNREAKTRNYGPCRR
jgi:hypothetical protein